MITSYAYISGHLLRQKARKFFFFHKVLSIHGYYRSIIIASSPSLEKTTYEVSGESLGVNDEDKRNKTDK